MEVKNKHLALSTRLQELFPEVNPERTRPSGRKLRWKLSSRALWGALLLSAATVAVICVVIGGMNSQAASATAQTVSVEVPGIKPAAAQPTKVANSANPADPSHSGEISTASDQSLPVVVHMIGAIRKPGVLRMPTGSRVYQAIAAAGGALPAAALAALNLAALLQDGQQIIVPNQAQLRSEPVVAPLPASTSGAGSAAPISGKVNLNTATPEQLAALPRVGPVLAQRIIDWRKEHEGFKTTGDLDSVGGIGSKMLETLLPLVTI